MLRIVHQFLKWLPPAAFGALLAIATVWPSAKDWIGQQATLAWTQLDDPLLACGTLLVAGLYVTALVWSGREQSLAPRLRGQVDSIISNDNMNDDRIWLWLNVSIRNSGSPTSIEEIMIFSKKSGEKPVLWERFNLMQEAVFHVGSHTVTLRRNRDSLIDKCVSPIPTGAMVRGWMHALSWPNSVKTLDEVVFHISFRDITGKTYRVRYDPRKAPHFDAPKYYPDGTGGEYGTSQSG